jgi:hypothetical protein
MKKSWIVLALLAVVAFVLAVVLFWRRPADEPAEPGEKRVRLAPGDLSDDLLDEVADEPLPAAATGTPAADAAPGQVSQPGIAAPVIAPSPQAEPGIMPDPGLLARFELILGDMPVDERPTDVVWTCPEAPHTCNVEGTLAANEHIANFMHGLEDNPQAEDDEIPTVHLNHLESLPEGGKRFQLQLELP